MHKHADPLAVETSIHPIPSVVACCPGLPSRNRRSTERLEPLGRADRRAVRTKSCANGGTSRSIGRFSKSVLCLYHQTTEGVKIERNPLVLLASHRIDVDLASEDRLKKRPRRPSLWLMDERLVGAGLACGLAADRVQTQAVLGQRQEVRPSGTHARKHSDTDEHWLVPPKLGR